MTRMTLLHDLPSIDPDKLHAIDVEAFGIDDDTIEHLLQSVTAMTTVAYEIFGDLINTQNPAQDMPTLLGELRQRSDDRTFFLPTQFVQ